jgi:drug/metabolite transporter (DMT)-like permease
MCARSIVRTAGRRLYGQPYVLLVLTTLFWGGNVVAGKLAIGQVSPMALTFLRWLIAFVAIALVARRQIAAEWRHLLPAWRYTVLMAGLGLTAFNALFYSAAYYTSAINVAIIQGSTPIFVLLGTLVLGTRFRMLQICGVLATLLGVVLTATRGDLEVLSNLALNRGDVWMLVASILYALFTLALRWKPRVSALVFFAAMAAAACVTSLPLVIAESLTGQLKWPSAWGWLILLYVGLLPSLLGQIFYIRGIELIGPGRASVFYNLVPVFGAVLSTILLAEPFALYHILALCLVLGGIAVAERGRT